MEISYLGHASFKIKTKTGTVVTDPFAKSIGITMPTVSADLVTVSHMSHDDHNAVGSVAGTARRKTPFVINEPGEYEVEGISVFGYQTFHDNAEGAERGKNTIYVIQAEELRILHLGDLGHTLNEKILGELENIDVVMVPVGGVYTIGPKEAIEVVSKLEPTYVLPMHFQNPKLNQDTYGKLEPVENFITQYEHGAKTVKTLSLGRASLPEDVTEIILFEE